MDISIKLKETHSALEDRSSSLQRADREPPAVRRLLEVSKGSVDPEESAGCDRIISNVTGVAG